MGRDGRLYNGLAAAPNLLEHVVCAKPLLTVVPAMGEGATKMDKSQALPLQSALPPGQEGMQTDHCSAP